MSTGHTVTVTLEEGHEECLAAWRASEAERIGRKTNGITGPLTSPETWCGGHWSLGCLEFQLSCDGNCGIDLYLECDHTVPDDVEVKCAYAASDREKKYGMCQSFDLDICDPCAAWYRYYEWWENSDHMSNGSTSYEIQAGECWPMWAAGENGIAECWNGPQEPGVYEVDCDNEGDWESGYVTCTPTVPKTELTPENPTG